MARRRPTQAKPSVSKTVKTASKTARPSTTSARSRGASSRPQRSAKPVSPRKAKVPSSRSTKLTGSRNVKPSASRKAKVEASRNPKTAPSSVPSFAPSIPSIDEPSHVKTLLTRRGFLYGALGIGAAAVVAGGVGAAVSLSNSSEDEEAISILEVPASAVTSSDDLEEIKASDAVSLKGSYQLPYGTLVWASSDSLAACLLPTEETSKPLTQVGVLSLSSGDHPTVLKKAVGQDEGFDIYDVRVNESGLVWTEANILQNSWRIYAATFEGGNLGDQLKVDEGDGEWETPTIALAGSFAFWQVLPLTTGAQAGSNSVLKRVRFGSSDVEIIYTSQGRMSTPPYSLSDGIVITPRTKTSSVHHQLTLIDASEGTVKDTLVLPNAMKPLEAGYGATGFNFSFEGTYNYGDGIANLGTYTPLTTPTPNNYAALSWLRYARVPSAPPSWCKNFFMVKSTSSVCGLNFVDKTYFVIETENGSDTYGDYLASTGLLDTAVTFANINHTGIDGVKKHYCLVRVWEPA